MSRRLVGEPKPPVRLDASGRKARVQGRAIPAPTARGRFAAAYQHPQRTSTSGSPRLPRFTPRVNASLRIAVKLPRQFVKIDLMLISRSRVTRGRDAAWRPGDVQYARVQAARCRWSSAGTGAGSGTGQHWGYRTLEKVKIPGPCRDSVHLVSKICGERMADRSEPQKARARSICCSTARVHAPTCRPHSWSRRRSGAR